MVHLQANAVGVLRAVNGDKLLTLSRRSYSWLFGCLLCACSLTNSVDDLKGAGPSAGGSAGSAGDAGDSGVAGAAGTWGLGGSAGWAGAAGAGGATGGTDAGTGGVGGSKTPPTIVYRSAYTVLQGQSAYSFTGVDLGVADPSRVAIVGISVRTTGPVPVFSNVTIGGIAASLAATEVAASHCRVSLYYAAVPTGTTATVAFDVTNAAFNAAIATWSAYNLTAPTPAAWSTSISDPGSLDMTLTQGDVVTAFAVSRDDTPGSPIVHHWTGLTERMDQELGTGSQSMSAADHVAVSTAAHAMSVDFDTPVANTMWTLAAAAAWR